MSLHARYRTIYRLEAWRRHFVCRRGKFVDSVYDKLKGEMIIKKRALLGFAEKDDKHCTILNRLIDFTVSGDGPVITYEPDPRHVDLLREHMGLEGAKAKASALKVRSPERITTKLSSTSPM